MKPTHVIPHRHAPVPATMVTETGISLEQAETVRWIIKESTQDDLLNKTNFPKTSLQYDKDKHSIDDLCLFAINETMNGNGINEHIMDKNISPVLLKHVSLEDTSRRSIGFNSSSRHFYLRSEDEVQATIKKLDDSYEAERSESLSL